MQPRNSNFTHWINTGYTLFAEEGLEALNIERLSRVAGLSKSGFYHHFSDREGFLKHLLERHQSDARAMVLELQAIKSIDPDLLDILIRWKTSVLAHQQLVKNRSNKNCLDCLHQVNALTDPIIIPIWADFIGLPNNPALAFHFYEVVRDMFYARLTEDQFTMPGLRQLVVNEAKRVVDLLTDVGHSPKLFQERLQSPSPT